MLSCEQATRLLSESQERSLTLSEKNESESTHGNVFGVS